jgi:hypothetical protein
MKGAQRILLGLMVLGMSSFVAPGQYISPGDREKLERLDDSLKMYGNTMLDDSLATNRLRADSMFTRLLVRSLLVPYSFYFSYDSMQMAPVVYAPDSNFRIISWHIPMHNDNHRQKGVIQMRTDNGSPKFFPLFDASDYTDRPLDSVREANNWIGAVYYRVLHHSLPNGPVYTLLGYDENNDRTTRKWIDILSFDESGKPLFGGDFFSIPSDSIFPRGSKRFVLEYKKEGRVRLNFDDEDSLIVMDNLVSETGEPEKKYTLIPGGDYEGLKWQNGRWQYIDKLYMQARGDGNEPREMTILDEEGNFDENALQKQTEKNLKKSSGKEKSEPEKGKTPKKKTRTR